jgi:hypothetical protein
LTQLTDNLMQNKFEETEVYETTAELDVFEEKTREPSPVDYVFEEEWSSRQSGGAREAREGARW